MEFISVKIEGIPYGKNKTRGDTDAPKKWSEAVIEQTKDLPKIKEACIVNLIFLLPQNKFPRDFPFGPDMDNLLKRFFDALNETIFSEAEGKDSCVISLNTTKVKVENDEQAGARLEIIPVKV